MKRYISSVLMVVVIVLSIGTYYVQVNSYASSLPKITFKTVEGDEKELNSIILNGYYEEGNVSEPFSIDSNKITYQREMSYYDQLVGYSMTNYKRLVKEYRSFMRGKEYVESYYEDKDNLTFVTTDIDYDNRKYASNFNIDILEKKNKEKKTFEIGVPDQEKYQNIAIRDVQFVQSKLQVITQNDVISNNEKDLDEIHLYTIDLAGKKIVSDDMLLSETFDSSNEGHFSTVSKAELGKANNVFVVGVVKGSYSEEGEFKEKKGESSIFAYHYDTKKLEKIKLPKEMDISYESVESDLSYDEENLYMRVWEEGNATIHTFNIDKQKTINVFKPESVDFTSIQGGRIFAVTRGELLIADAKTGKMLYKGELVINSDDEKKNQIIQLHEVTIK